MFKKLALLSLATLLIIPGSIYFYVQQFTSLKLASTVSAKYEVSSIEFPTETMTLFEHPLQYLGEGNQAYAFKSVDGNSVVKFFKSAPLQSTSWLDFMPNFTFFENLRQKSKKRAQRKFERLFNAYAVAYENDREHCGLQCIHLYPTNDLNIEATVIDAWGFQHQIDLNNTAFIVQKKGEPLRALFKRELSQGQVQLVKEQLRLVIEMYLAEYQKGIFDHDHNLMANVGFADGRPLRIDVGKLVLDPSYMSKDVYLADLDKIIHQRIEKWFVRHYPQDAQEILDTLEPLLNH